MRVYSNDVRMFSRFGYQTSSFTKELLSRPTHFAVEALSVSLMRYNASVIELGSEDTALYAIFYLKVKTLDIACPNKLGFPLTACLRYC
ncbi:unnamed protein product [Brassica oleracea var. botrytis]|uniref:Uncharacterized protein n=1 Tax=Brassica oleracea var. oleracea TaxID=109376 RepID=A0A0D3B3E0_BRAOL